jgi:hypothetical protein
MAAARRAADRRAARPRRDLVGLEVGGVVVSK